MIIVLYNATQQGNNVFIKEWDYNYGIRGEAMNTFEELFKEYIGEDLKLIKMKQIIYEITNIPHNPFIFFIFFYIL